MSSVPANSHAVLDCNFDAEAQRAMRHDDSEAWMAVTSILFVIVTGGAVLGIVGVLFAL